MPSQRLPGVPRLGTISARSRRFVLEEKSEYIDDDGNVKKMPGAQYADNGVKMQY